MITNLGSSQREITYIIIISGCAFGILIFYILGMMTIFVSKVIKRFITSKYKRNNNTIPYPVYEDIRLESQRNFTIKMDQNSAYGNRNTQDS